MPPDGELLKPDQIGLLSRWIETGADWPGQMDATGEGQAPSPIHSDHWSFRSVAKKDWLGSSESDSIESLINGNSVPV